MADSSATGGRSPSTVAPFIRAKRVAFHSLLQKLREPWHHSSLIGTSEPGLAPRARVKPGRVGAVAVDPVERVDHVAERLRHLLAVTVADHAVQRDDVERLDAIFIAYRPNIIIRATQKNRMS